VRFWDASAILPLLVAEPTTRRLQALAARDPDMLVWWGSEVECISALVRRESAMRSLRVHPLRAADALQLAAAFIAAERRPSSLEVITLDERLAEAARKEGFALVDLTTG
jgi:predicted nucleic acid-binding protein